MVFYNMIQVFYTFPNSVKHSVLLSKALLTFFPNSPFLPKILGKKGLYYKNIQIRLGLIEVSPDYLFPESPECKVDPGLPLRT